MVVFREVGVAFYECFDCVGVVGAVDVRREELVDEAGEHDVAGEVEGVGRRRQGVGVGGWHFGLFGRGGGDGRFRCRSLHLLY